MGKDVTLGNTFNERFFSEAWTSVATNEESSYETSSTNTNIRCLAKKDYKPHSLCSLSSLPTNHAELDSKHMAMVDRQRCNGSICVLLKKNNRQTFCNYALLMVFLSIIFT